jgi:hypothetical protein
MMRTAPRISAMMARKETASEKVLPLNAFPTFSPVELPLGKTDVVSTYVSAATATKINILLRFIDSLLRKIHQSDDRG